MDTREIDSLRRSAVEALSRVSATTEAVYLRMADAFPSMVRELDSDFGQDRVRARAALTEAIREALENIQQQEARFDADSVHSRDLLTNLERQVEALTLLGAQISEIREDSVLMELFSLNALVIAVKAGPAGQAFSCITSELKKLSNQTMGLTDLIATREAALREAFLDFQENFRKLGDQESRAVGDFLVEVRRVFTGLDAETAGVLEGLEAMGRRSEEVKTPLVRIMVDIQNQDRIRQSLDHVQLSLDAFQAIDPSAPLESRLDELSFLEILPDLSNLVLEEVSGQVRDNRESFIKNVTEARTKINHLEDELRSYLDQRLGSHRAGGLDALFREGTAAFAAFVVRTEELQRAKETLFRKSSLLQKKVGELVDSLSLFGEVISKFRNIDLASRIQVARQAALRSMKDNAAGMTGLTQKIEADVGQAIAVTGSFFTEVQATFSAYRDQWTVRVRQDEAFNLRLRNTMGRLEESQAVLQQSIRGSQVFSRAFTDQFAATEKDLLTLDNLLKEMGDQSANLRILKNKFSEQKTHLLRENGLTEWKLANGRLKDMISRFTIFTHKKFAAELGNFEVDEGVESGEVTLF